MTRCFRRKAAETFDVDSTAFVENAANSQCGSLPRFPRHLPTYVEQATIRTLECPNGGHHAVINDLPAFRPWCGPDKTPPHAAFEDNLAAQRRLLALVGELLRRLSDRADLRALVDELGVERPNLVGLSIGANISLDFALAYREWLLPWSSLRGILGSPDPAWMETGWQARIRRA